MGKICTKATKVGSSVLMIAVVYVWVWAPCFQVCLVSSSKDCKTLHYLYRVMGMATHTKLRALTHVRGPRAAVYACEAYLRKGLGQAVIPA